MKVEESTAADASPTNAKAAGRDTRKFQRQRNPIKSEEDASNSYGIMPHYVAAERGTKAPHGTTSSHASASGGGSEHGGLGGLGGAGSGISSPSNSGIASSCGSAVKAIKNNKITARLSGSASGCLSDALNDTAPVTLPLRLEPPSVEIYSNPFCAPAVCSASAPAAAAVSSTFGSENKMFFIQLPRTFPALPNDFSAAPSERPFYNNITQMSTSGSRFHVDPPPVAASSTSASAMAADAKPAQPSDSRSRASGLLIPPAEESVVIKEEGDSSEESDIAQKTAALFDPLPLSGSLSYTAPAFDILDTREDHVSDKFKNSGQLGTMRFWKSGRVTMMVGSIEFDVSRGAESNFLQQVRLHITFRAIHTCHSRTIRWSTSACPTRAWMFWGRCADHMSFNHSLPADLLCFSLTVALSWRQ
jgi:hypothetical protein